MENILIKYDNEENNKYIIKLAGYGCSKRLLSLSSYCNTYIGTSASAYMSPEILKGKKYNYKCDLWSIGIIIYRLIFGKSPYLGVTEFSLIDNIKTIGNKFIEKIENEELKALVERLLEKEPTKRIDWDNYFRHPFFKSRNINIKYYANYDDKKENIFGEKFVENNKNNIELMINGKKNELEQKYKLKKGEIIYK